MALDLTRLESSPHLTTLLIQMEDVLDTLDLYVFKNWFHGEVIAGPEVHRYWLGLTLKYKHDQKPDERGALRLIKHGLLCTIAEGKEGERTTQPDGKNPKEKVDPVWIVTLKIPRRLITDLNAGQLDFYDDEGEIDAEDIQDANDDGMTDETGYVDPSQDVPQEDVPPEGAPSGAPGAPPPKGGNGPAQ